jgi:PAS domain S-box-containing protein
MKHLDSNQKSTMEQEAFSEELMELRRQNAELEARVAQLSQIEQTLNAILKGTAGQTGEDFFASLVQYLAETLGASYALVGELIGPRKDAVQTIAFWHKDRLANNFVYRLANTPCAKVVGQQVRHYPTNVAQLFPENALLQEKEITCYIGAPIFDSAGESLGILAVMDNQEIKQGVDFVPIVNLFAARAGAEIARKRSLETLSNSEQRYRNLVEQSNEAIFLAHKNRFVFVNQRFCEMFGLSREEILAGKFHLTDLAAPESIPLFRERSQQWASGQPVPEQFEFTARTAQGEVLPLAVSVSYLPYGEGTAVQGILWDLAQRKQAEAEERSQRELAIALAQQNAQLLAAANQRTQELDLLNRVISAAASGLSELEITQVVCQEIAGHLAIDHVSLMEVDDTLTAGFVAAQHIAPTYPSLIGRVLQLSPKNSLIQEILTRRSPIVIEEVAQYPVDAKTKELAGMYSLITVLLVPIFLRGSLLGIMSVGSTTHHVFSADEIRLLHTISEELGRILETARLYDQLRRHAAELEERVAERTSELAEANAQLQELDQLKSQFVSDVSHELRTPVTNLKLYLDLLEHKGESLLPKYLPILHKQADRLGQLIADILDISRLDMRRNQPPAFSAVDLNSVTQDVINAHQLRIAASGLQLTFTPCPALPPILGVYNQLAQVVTNLLTNAIHYTPAGFINIRLSLQSGGKWVCLAVEDSGIGIAEDDMVYLFNRFYRGQHARQSNIPGTGLGLAIVQDIVQLHGGHIEVFSRPGEGSTFTAYLPVEPVGSADATSPGQD